MMRDRVERLYQKALTETDPQVQFRMLSAAYRAMSRLRDAADRFVCTTGMQSMAKWREAEEILETEGC